MNSIKNIKTRNLAAKNLKSDVIAKAQYKAYLEKNGFSKVRITGSPADITAEKNGETHYFEIKMTKQVKNYFGAATMTEWKSALENPEKFKFIVAITDKYEKKFIFKEYTPLEFMKYSTIPPFKVFFNLNLENDKQIIKRRTALQATEEVMKILIHKFQELNK